MSENSVPQPDTGAEPPDDRESKLLEQWAAKQDAARKVHADYDAVIAATKMPEGPGVLAMREALLKAKNGAEVLYYLARHPHELERIAALSPAGAIEEIAMLSVSREPAYFDPQFERRMAEAEAALMRSREVRQEFQISLKSHRNSIDEMFAPYRHQNEFRFARHEKEAAEIHALYMETVRRGLKLTPAGAPAPGVEPPPCPPAPAAPPIAAPEPSSASDGTPVSKRGRPPIPPERKEEVLRRRAEATARGEKFPWREAAKILYSVRTPTHQQVSDSPNIIKYYVKRCKSTTTE